MLTEYSLKKDLLSYLMKKEDNNCSNCMFMAECNRLFDITNISLCDVVLRCIGDSYVVDVYKNIKYEDKK